MKRFIGLFVALSVLSGADALGLSVTIDSTSKPYSGIQIKTGHSNSPKRNFVAAFVSLCTDHVHVTATKPPKARQTAGAWGKSQGVQLAVNGDFFKYVTPPTVYGDAVGGGVHWPASLTGVDDSGDWYYRKNGWIAVGGGWVEFSHSKHVKDNAAAFEKAGYSVAYGFEPKKVSTAIPPGTQALVSGFSELVIEGKVYTCPDPAKAGACFPDRSDMKSAHLRTAMGITKDRNTLIFLVMKSATYGEELAQIMGKLGAWEAFNLDGGGSSTMWTAKNGTIFPTGEIRQVANHWGVYATTSKPAAPGSCHQAGGCFPTPVPGAEGSDFADYPTSWLFYSSAKLLYDYGLDDGCGVANGKPLYCPKCPVTRREAAVTMARAASLDTTKPPASPTFSDVPKSDPAYAEIEAIAKAGITNGCGGGKFCPENSITRAQAATFLRKSAGWKLLKPATATFADVPKTAMFFNEIETIAANCVTNGCGDGTNFCPDDTIPREQFAVFVARTFDLDNANKCLDYCDTTTCAGGPDCGAWSACGGFDGDCDETGTKTRKCTTFPDCKPLSLDKTCGAKASTETTACTVDKDGEVVSGWTPWGACGGFDGPCDETGTQTRTRVVCTNGKATTKTGEQGCTVATTGKVVSDWTPFGACEGDPCAGVGEKLRERVVCAGGVATTDVESAPCAPGGVCGADAGGADTVGGVDAGGSMGDGGAAPDGGVPVADVGAWSDAGAPTWVDTGAPPVGDLDAGTPPVTTPDAGKPPVVTTDAGTAAETGPPGGLDAGAPGSVPVTIDVGTYGTSTPLGGPDALASKPGDGAVADGCNATRGAPVPPVLVLFLVGLAIRAFLSRRAGPYSGEAEL